MTTFGFPLGAEFGTTPLEPPRTAPSTDAPVPGIGEIVYLASCVIQAAISGQITPPDAPNQYTADFKVMGDRGDINLDALVGRRGPGGKGFFALRAQDTPIGNPADLPLLSNITRDIGKYWLIDEIDLQGHILAEWAYIWWGSFYRVMMMGSVGAPGPVPDIDPLITVIPPDEMSYVHTSGTIMNPSWDFMIAAPAGVPGPVGAVHTFPDVDETSIAPVNADVLAYTGRTTKDGRPIWAPFGIEQLSPAPYSMPESAFTPYVGVSQQAAIGSFAVPPQPFPWTPVVWGHMGGAGLHLSLHPLMIGVQVLLGDPTVGVQVARGMGNTLGEVNIMPHWSTPQKTGVAISSKNKIATVPANHTGSQGTVYINLFNDGQLGAYFFAPNDAQLFIMAVPVDSTLPYTASAYPILRGRGKLKAKARRGS